MNNKEKELEFCRKLTALLIEYGLGIADEPHIYELQSGSDSDYGRIVSIDDERRIQFF
ncbi:MAG: hypothetical protein ABSC11_11880 [Smithella sp.]|jgi:hypothetical protein